MTDNSRDEREPVTAAPHLANILDPIHATLDPRVFVDPAAPEPTLRPEVTHWFQATVFELLERHGYDHPQDWLTLILTGSLTTYQYGETSDADLGLFVDAVKFPDWSRSEMISIMITDLDDVRLPGTPYPIQAYVVPHDLKPADLYKSGLRSGYVVFGQGAGTWIVPPEPERSHDVEKDQHDAYTVGLLACDKMDLLLRYEPAQAVEYWHRIHKQRQSDEAAGLGDYATSNIVYKMLFNRGLTPRIADVSGEHIT